MPSVDSLVRLLILLWFSLGLLAGIALFFDRFLVFLYLNYSIQILDFTITTIPIKPLSSYDTHNNTSSFWTPWNILYVLYFNLIHI